jgi:Phosphodiester glycosidase
VAWNSNPHRRFLPLVVLLSGVTALAACSGVSALSQPQSHQTATASSAGSTASGRAAPAGGGPAVVRVVTPGTAPLPGPAALLPFPGTSAYGGEGAWQPAGRLVAGKPAVYETLLVPPGGTKRAGIAWMDTSLLTARLYSGSVSPGGGPYKYTAPVAPAAAGSLVAAFNGGFKMKDAHGGYYTEGRMIRPLVPGAASLVIYADGAVTVGAWGSDVTMTPSVVAVRQNLYPLVVNGEPSARASTRTWRVWGGTCPCGPGLHGSDFQWRSGLGVTADGALVYVAGPLLTPPQVAALLVRAGAVRGMELDINPSWPVFASFKPAAADGLAAPSNGTRLIDTSLGPATFFSPAYARDFITMSARPAPGSR